MLSRKQLFALKTLKPVPEIPPPVWDHILYVANTMVGHANLVDADMCDIIQRLCLEVIIALPKCRPKDGVQTGTTFLNCVVDRRAKNIFRERMVARIDTPWVPIADCVLASEQGEADAVTALTVDYERSRRISEVHNLVAKLPEELRDICELLQDGLSCEKIAKRCGVAAVTIRTRILPQLQTMFREAGIGL